MYTNVAASKRITVHIFFWITGDVNVIETLKKIRPSCPRFLKDRLGMRFRKTAASSLLPLFLLIKSNGEAFNKLEAEFVAVDYMSLWSSTRLYSVSYRVMDRQFLFPNASVCSELFGKIRLLYTCVYIPTSNNKYIIIHSYMNMFDDIYISYIIYTYVTLIYNIYIYNKSFIAWIANKFQNSKLQIFSYINA